MHATEVPPNRCTCGSLLDCASAAPGVNGTSWNAVPEPGSLTVCIRCGQLYEFDEVMNLKPRQLSELPAEVQKEILRVKRAIHELHRTKS